jgi:hypothetical protein
MGKGKGCREDVLKVLSEMTAKHLCLTCNVWGLNVVLTATVLDRYPGFFL